MTPEDDSAPIDANLRTSGRARRSRWTSFRLEDEPSAEERAAQRRAVRRVFRVYCVACGRSSEVAVAPARPGRCVHCGGTMLVEVSSD